MVIEAFPLAEKYRNPVMILGDGLIGQMMEPVEFPDDLAVEQINNDDWATSGMETRKSKERNLIKTLFLDADLLNVHNLKLKAKYERMAAKEVRYENYNTETDYRALIVSYGTMSRVCRTVIDNMKAKGVEVALIRPQTLFPFPSDAISKAAQKMTCQVVVCVEMSMGQMVEDVDRCVQGRKPVEWYGKCGGDIPTPEETTEVIEGFLK